MIDEDKPIEVNCHFCGKTYKFDVDELKKWRKNPDERRFLKLRRLRQNRVADPAWNAQEICKVLDACYEQHAKLIVLPELCLTGYTCQDLFCRNACWKKAWKGCRRCWSIRKGTMR